MRKQQQLALEHCLFLLLLLNLLPFSQQQYTDLLFSYDCSDILQFSNPNFSYDSSSFDYYTGIETLVEHNINVNYYCTPQLYDYNSETTCEGFGNANILANNFQPNTVCTSSSRIGILGLEFASTFATNFDSAFGTSFFSFDFMTLGIPKTTQDQPHILIDVQPPFSVPEKFNSRVPVDVTLNFQRGSPSDFLITLSNIIMQSSENDFGFSIYCDSYEVVAYLIADANESPQRFTSSRPLSFPTITSEPTTFATTHCNTGGRFQIVANNGFFSSIIAKIEPIISLLRMESPVGDELNVVQTLIYLRNQNEEIFLGSLQVASSNFSQIATPIFTNRWYTLNVLNVYTSDDQDENADGAYPTNCEQTLTISLDRIIIDTLANVVFSPLSANFFKFLIGGVNGFIDNIEFAQANITSSTSLPAIPPQPDLPPQNNSVFCDPFFYFPCNSEINQIKNSPAEVVLDGYCGPSDSMVDYANEGVDGKPGICKSQIYNCNNNVLQVEGVSADSLTVSYFYQQPFGSPFDSFELLSGYEIGFFSSNISTHDLGTVPNTINLSSHYLQFSYNFELQFVVDTFNVSIYFHWPTENDKQLIATFRFERAESIFYIVHGASSDFVHGNYTIILLPSFNLAKGQSSIWSVETYPPGSIADSNPILPTLKAVPTVTFLRLEDTLQLPILQVFSMDQTIYYNHKFYIQEACLLWNTKDYGATGWLEMFMNINSDGFSIDTFCSDGFTYQERKINNPAVTVNTNLVNSITIGPIGGYIDEIMIFNYTRPYSINKNCVQLIVPPSVSSSAIPTRTLSPLPSSFTPSLRPSMSQSPNLSFLNGPLISNDPVLPLPSPSLTPFVFNSQVGAFSSSPFPVVIPSLASSPSPQRSIAISSEVNTANIVGIPDVVEVTYLPSDFTSTSGSIQVSYTSPELISLAAPSLGSTNIISSTVSIITIGTTVSSSIEICLATPQDSDKNVCLGYIDESKVPPEWVCEDKCLNSKDNYLCGKTDHLTSFALLFQGLAKGGKCGSSQYEYIFGSSLKDFYLIISFAGLAILIALIAIILYSFTPARKLILGKEGSRVALLRERQTSLATATSSASAADIPV